MRRQIPMTITPFWRRQESIISAAILIGGLFSASAVLGIAREYLLAYYFGDSTPLSLFYLADRIPSFVFNVLVVGSFATAFIPVFIKQFKKSEGDAWYLASQALNATLSAFALISVTLIILAPYMVSGLTSGRLSSAESLTLVALFRVMLLAQLILIISTFLTVLLQSFNHFLMPALAPVCYNVGLIVGVIVAGRFGILYAAWGMVGGALIHLLIQLPQVRRLKFNYRLILDFKFAPFLEMLRLLLPRTLGVVVAQISVLVDTYLAASLSVAAIVPYTRALKLQNLPLGVFGLAMSQALFPTLSQKALGENRTEFRKVFLTSFTQLAFLIMPVAAIFLVLRVPVARLVFGTSLVSWEATLTTSYALAFFALALFPQAANLSLIKAFYALYDTKTQLIVSGLATLLNIVVAVAFLQLGGFGVWGLSLAYLVSSSLECGGLLFMLSKKVGGFPWQQFGKPLFKILMATFIMAGFLYLPLKKLDLFVLDTRWTFNLLGLSTISCLLGLVIYLTLTYLFKVQEIVLLWKLLRKIGFNVKASPSPETIVYGST